MKYPIDYHHQFRIFALELIRKRVSDIPKSMGDISQTPQNAIIRECNSLEKCGDPLRADRRAQPNGRGDQVQRGTHEKGLSLLTFGLLHALFF